VSLARFNKS